MGGRSFRTFSRDVFATAADDYPTEEQHMYIAIARFPAVLDGQENDFQDWFAWSNEQLRGTTGLKARRLLRAADGSYAALVEHESASTFAAMQTAEPVPMIHKGLWAILDDRPEATRYEVVVDSSTPEKCCGADHGTARKAGAVAAQTSGGCCQDA